MPDPVVRIVREWVEKAEEDLRGAALALKAGRKCPTGVVCFHAQQCVEKYLKAVLVARRLDFPKTHDIGELLVSIGKPIGVSIPVEERRRLTAYATVTRYPGSYRPITLPDARKAFALARCGQASRATPVALGIAFAIG